MSTLTFSTTNYQLQSPLFGVLPGEIRNEIFALALMPHEDKEATYPKDSYWFRPGFSAPRQSNSVLLRTCKAAYAEGQKVFLRELEWAFWFDRGPQGRSGYDACCRFFTRLPPAAVEALQKVRFFTQLYWLEDDRNLHRLFRIPKVRATQLTITIRYSDWWCWEVDRPLTMEETWLKTFLGCPGLRELRVEYETRVPKKEEMMAIVQRNKKYKLPVRREGSTALDDWEGYLSAENTALREWSWKGTSKLGGQEWSHLSKSETIEYVVVTDTWIFLDVPVTPDDLGREALGEDYVAMYNLPHIFREDSYFSEGRSPPSPVYSDEEDEDEEEIHSEEEMDDDDNDAGHEEAK